MDRIPPEKRSWNMGRIRSGNTRPEIAVRSLLHRMGYRFRIHHKGLPGKPDIVLPKFRTVVFVHGCFWHRHKGCKYTYNPKSRTEFWEEKFNGNRERDKKNRIDLEALGWKVLVVWECELRDLDQLAQRLKNEIASSEISYPQASLNLRMAAEKQETYRDGVEDRDENAHPSDGKQ